MTGFHYCRKHCLLLVLMLFLPFVSAFAVTNTFNFTVTDAVGGAAVPGATVYVWDKNSPYTNSSALTAANGSVQVVFDPAQIDRGRF